MGWLGRFDLGCSPDDTVVEIQKELVAKGEYNEINRPEQREESRRFGSSRPLGCGEGGVGE